MYGCPLNEAWGDDYQKAKKKKKKSKDIPLSPQEEIDTELLLTETDRNAFSQEPTTFQKIQGLEPANATDHYYGSVNLSQPEPRTTVEQQIQEPLRSISEEEWNEYLDYKRWKRTGETVLQKRQMIETMKNETSTLTTQDEQFNELLLYMFTGFFLLMLYDNIYKLGKSSY